MNDHAPEPNVEELQHTAAVAREALLSSISRLDDRVKEIKTHAVDATAASGWGIAGSARVVVELRCGSPARFAQIRELHPQTLARLACCRHRIQDRGSLAYRCPFVFIVPASTQAGHRDTFCESTTTSSCYAAGVLTHAC